MTTFKLSFLVLALLLASASIAVGSHEDSRLKQCKDECRVQKQHAGESELRQCFDRCEERYGGRHDDVDEAELNRESPIERLRECDADCDKQQRQGEQRERCHKQCQVKYEKEKERYEGGGSREEGPQNVDPDTCYRVCRYSGAPRQLCQRSCGVNREDEEEEGRNPSPYVFEDRHFFTGLETQHGKLRILEKFTKRSRLLRGIKNFRVAILEAQPQTFVVPNHWDADSVVFVAKGRGTVSFVRQNRRESFNIKEGDIFRIRAGTTTYLINKDNNERLVLVKLIQPVNTPGEFEAFFGAGGQNPESYYKAFSDEILEAAFNTRGEKLKKLFGEQRQGVIIKASREQIRAMSQHEEGGIWPFGGESKGTHSLFKQHSTHSNRYGQLYEVDPTQFRQLRDLDIAVSLANISQGAMTAPYYNSKATKISIVVDGEGYFEMACPHLSESSQGRPGRGDERYEEDGYESESEGRETRVGRGYQKVRSQLKVGSVVVVPAGHPFVAVASNNRNLQILCFEVNAYKNEKYTLAGKRNVLNQLEREAKELAFGIPAREVDEVFGRQQEDFFFPGPHQRRSEA